VWVNPVLTACQPAPLIHPCRLETDIASLEQHLETMRAAYQLNAEKLEYNYRVLRERDAENTATIAHQKRQLSRQHDVVLGLKQRYAATDAKQADDNSKLTDEYKRITEQFKDLQVRRRRVGWPVGGQWQQWRPVGVMRRFGGSLTTRIRMLPGEVERCTTVPNPNLAPPQPLSTQPLAISCSTKPMPSTALINPCLINYLPRPAAPLLLPPHTRPSSGTLTALTPRATLSCGS
jgi:hypothetical protein